MKWTRVELGALLDARRRSGSGEAQGDDAFIILRLRITPELLQAMLDGTWTDLDGSTARFDGVDIDDEGFAMPILTRLEHPVT